MRVRKLARAGNGRLHWIDGDGNAICGTRGPIGPEIDSAGIHWVLRCHGCDLRRLAELLEAETVIREYRADHDLGFAKGFTCGCAPCRRGEAVLGGVG